MNDWKIINVWENGKKILNMPLETEQGEYL